MMERARGWLVGNGVPYVEVGYREAQADPVGVAGRVRGLVGELDVVGAAGAVV